METLEQGVEPYLMAQGYITRTPRGRAATEKTMALLGGGGPNVNGNGNVNGNSSGNAVAA